MSGRLVLVVGSQCDAVNLELSVLPRAARDLAEVLVDPALGGWTPALSTGPVLIDPTAARLDEAIVAAMKRAHDEQATLFLVFVGHGGVEGDDFYLLAKDSEFPDSRGAVLIGQRVKELLRRYSALDGLVLVVDACHSGLAAEQAGRQWLEPMRRSRRRFELLTATDEGLAFGACMVRSVTRMIRTGEPDLGERIHCLDLKRRLGDLCHYQVAVHLTYDGSREIAEQDASLWIAMNAAPAWRSAALAGTGAMAEIERLTRFYQPTRGLVALKTVIAAGSRCVVLAGPRGSGKSTTIAALAKPGADADTSPHAVLLLNGSHTVEQAAVELARQLRVGLVGFVEASAEYWDRALPGQWPEVDAFDVHVLGPLRYLPDPGSVRIALDGIDAYPPVEARRLLGVADRVVADPGLTHVRLIVTGAVAAEHLTHAERVDLEPAERQDLARYARQRNVAEHSVGHLVDMSTGNWLAARCFAEAMLAATNTLSAEGSPPSEFDEAVRTMVRRAGLLRRDGESAPLHVVTSLLLAAGVGPVLPIELLLRASRALGGPTGIGPLRDVVLRLGVLVVRGVPGGDRERVGLADTVHADFLRRGDVLTVSEKSAHQALADAVDYATPEVADYAIASHARHLWAAGHEAAALDCIESHESAIPAENLARWSAATRWSISRRDLTLRARARVATWTAKSGDADTALRLLLELLDEHVAALGPDHLDTLSIRNNIAFWTGERHGWEGEATRLSTKLAEDCTRVLGATHPETLSALHLLALGHAKSGDVERGLSEFREVLRVREQVLSESHIGTLRSRHNILYWEAETEHPPPLSRSGPVWSTTCATWSGTITPKRSPRVTTRRCSPPSAVRRVEHSRSSRRCDRTWNACSVRGIPTRTRSSCSSRSGASTVTATSDRTSTVRPW